MVIGYEKGKGRERKTKKEREEIKSDDWFWIKWFAFLGFENKKGKRASWLFASHGL